jgi:transcriptional regulator with PAS, ATPase and Fis domain
MDGCVSRLVGQSAVLQRLRCNIERTARTDARVLITGESGTGKEVAARLIHAGSARASRPLVAVNCAGLADTLLESELFGHQRGSFTGAMRDKPGLLERAHLGVLFLDEVGEMSPRMQGLLLRFLETGELHRVGADHAAPPVDVRVIAATNRNLAKRVASGHFRLDLFYRLNVIELTIAPLRDRRDDIALLLHFFLDAYARQYRVRAPIVGADALAALQQYSWPGNVRQLKNLAERLVVRGVPTLTAADLSPEIGGASTDVPVAQPPVRSLSGDQLLDRMRLTGDSFWTVIYAPFMSRDLTRDDVRLLTARALELTRGNFGALMELFNMPPDDGRRFLNFLRKHQCQIDEQRFRSAALPRAVAADARQVSVRA